MVVIKHFSVTLLFRKMEIGIEGGVIMEIITILTTIFASAGNIGVLRHCPKNLASTYLCTALIKMIPLGFESPNACC